MKKEEGVDFIEGLTVDPVSDPESISIAGFTVAVEDVAGVKPKRKRKAKRQVWKYVLGDVYRLCHASDRNDAMLAFGADDTLRVDWCTLGDEFIYNLFREFRLYKSEYDGRNIFEFSFK
jgi:hypothetical protein